MSTELNESESCSEKTSNHQLNFHFDDFIEDTLAAPSECAIDIQSMPLGPIAGRIRPCPKHGNTCQQFVYMDNRSNKKSTSWDCPLCKSEKAAKRARYKKYELVKDGGSKCSICGYNKCLAAMDFHHLPEFEKKFAISKMLKRLPLEKLRPEAEKCIVLCANCHREIHASYEMFLTEEERNYSNRDSIPNETL
jgi:hypothetical protein